MRGCWSEGDLRSGKIAERQRVGGQCLAGCCPPAVCHPGGGMPGSAKARTVDLLIAAGVIAADTGMSGGAA